VWVVVLPVVHTPHLRPRLVEEDNVGLHLLGQEPRMGLELELDIAGCIVVVDTAAGHTCFGHKMNLAGHNQVDMVGSSFDYRLGPHRKDPWPEVDSGTQDGTAVGPLGDSPAIGWGKEVLDCFHCMTALHQGLGVVTAYWILAAGVAMGTNSLLLTVLIDGDRFSLS
jgi:hypothetical protein